MKPSKRIAALSTVLVHRASAIHAQLARERQHLGAIEHEIDTHTNAIAHLRDELVTTLTPSGVVRRNALMRIRGQQAVGRFQIACHQLEVTELEASRNEAREAIAKAQSAATALRRRQKKHEKWMCRMRAQRLLRQDLQMESETMERVGYDHDR